MLAIRHKQTIGLLSRRCSLLKQCICAVTLLWSDTSSRDVNRCFLVLKREGELFKRKPFVLKANDLWLVITWCLSFPFYSCFVCPQIVKRVQSEDWWSTIQLVFRVFHSDVATVVLVNAIDHVRNYRCSRLSKERGLPGDAGFYTNSNRRWTTSS